VKAEAAPGAARLDRFQKADCAGVACKGAPIGPPADAPVA